VLPRFLFLPLNRGRSGESFLHYVETFSPKSFAVSKRFANFALALPISFSESGGAKFLWVK